MAWNDSPPTAEELKGAKRWDIAPPTAEELSPKESMLDAKLPFDTTPRGLIQGGLNALPAAGMIAGGVMGMPAGGPVGGVAGAGLGAAAGESLKNFGEKLMGKPKTMADTYLNPLKAGAEGAASEAGGQAMSAGLKAAAESAPGKYVLGKIGKGASKLASTFSGVPEKEIETYAKNAEEINKMAKASDFDTQEMADQMRSRFNDDIQATKKGLRDQISDALANNRKAIDPKPILSALEEAKAGINEKLHPEDLKQIDDMIGRIKDLSDGGPFDAKTAHEVKEYLQEQARGAYARSGQIFQGGDKAQRAAKAGAAVVRGLVNDAAPEVAAANNQLSKLHDIEDVMNRNLLSEGKTASSLLAAGSGGNPANAKVLEDLGKATGTNILGEAEKLAAARTFGNPSLLPVDTTGKSLTRMGVAGGAGYLLGHLPGALAAEALASPAALKAAINTGRTAAPVALNPEMQGLLIKKLLEKNQNP